MDRIKLLNISGKEIISVDYSGCKTEQMIALFDEVHQMVVNGKGNCLVLTNFERTYITTPFMRHVKPVMQRVKHLIKKNAFVGMSLTQRTILKGFTFFIGEKTYVAFDTRDEAIAYLLSDD